MPVSGATDGMATLKHRDHHIRVEFAGLTRAAPGKDQDRFIALPHGHSGMVFGICDGHSIHDNSHGQKHAEAAARHLAGDLWRRVHDELAATTSVAPPPAPTDGSVPPPPTSASLADAASASFVAHQAVTEQSYEKTVAGPMLAEKKKLEEEIGDELPLELPQEGGTTATALVVHPAGGILSCWVGDSRAILAVDVAEVDASPREAAPESVVLLESASAPDAGTPTVLRVIPLTRDHNVSDEVEKQRLLDKGGSTGAQDSKMKSHVFVKDAEGGLKVTRSLGDSPFHKGDAVSAQPGLSHLPLTANTRFAVVCSDGIWDHLSNHQVATLVARAIEAYERENRSNLKERSGSEKTSPSHTPSSSLRENSQGGNEISREISREASSNDREPGSPGGAGHKGGGGWRKKRRGLAAAAACAAVLDFIEEGQKEGGALDASLVDDRSIAVAIFSTVVSGEASEAGSGRIG